MKKPDRRIVRTRQELADALIALALECGYGNFSIRAVTEQARVGYRTFHRHYKSLDDLLLEIFKTAFQELKRRALEAETPHDEGLAMYTFIRDHPDILRVYVNLPWEHPARQAIVSEAAQIMSVRYSPQHTSNAPLDVSIDHLIMATNSMVAWYLDHLDEYTPEQAAAIHDELVIRAVENQALDLRDDWAHKRHHLR